MNPEQAAIRAFVVRARQGLYLALQSDGSSRQRLLERLLSGRDIDPGAAVPLADDEQKPTQIAERLRKLGAPDDCHVVADNDKLDGCEAKLDDALKQIVGSGKRGLVICIPGRLAFFEGDNKERFLLQTAGGRKSADRR